MLITQVKYYKVSTSCPPTNPPTKRPDHPLLNYIPYQKTILSDGAKNPQNYFTWQCVITKYPVTHILLATKRGFIQVLYLVLRSPNLSNIILILEIDREIAKKYITLPTGL
ncbi:UNVERIFIED_CONTAM: hypothetical protein K2H54_020151 [Gekko kuhli]